MPLKISGALYKTTIVIWSEYDGNFCDIELLAADAMRGEAYCSKQESELVLNPKDDLEWDGTEFFNNEEKEGL